MSSGEFSFDHAAPVEAVDDANESANSSIMQSSPDTGSFSQVTSAQRSDSVKRQRPAIEDAERESRPVGRERGSSTRNPRSISAPRTGRNPSVRRTHGKAKSSGGSPLDKRGKLNADEELDARIREMEDQDVRRMEQIQRLEDENTAQKGT